MTRNNHRVFIIDPFLFMRKIFPWLGLLLLLVACNPRDNRPATDGEPQAAADTLPLVPLGDPFILYHDGLYYAYGTHAEEGIEVYTSADLHHWHSAGLALRRQDSWGDRWFWASEVYRVNGRFYMYYSADEHICVATSASPAGPFVQAEQVPMLPDEKCIDSSLFIDDDGTPYLTFVRFTDGNNIWIARLEDDYITIRPGTLRPCIHVSQPWEEVWPRVNEASFLLKRNGLYYLTYSANSYESPSYGVGCATTRNLLDGPWEKYPENPLLQSPPGLTGTGHSSLFTDAEGRLRIVYHAHRDSAHIHPRAMYIGHVHFQSVNGQERMRISQEYITPRLAD